MNSRNRYLKKWTAVTLAVTMLPVGQFADIITVYGGEETTVEAVSAEATATDTLKVLEDVQEADSTEVSEDVQTTDDTEVSEDAQETDNTEETVERVLTSDTIYYGDYVLSEGSLDLNGKTLTVYGDFVQEGGTLIMQDEAGTLRIEGGYYNQTTDDQRGYLTAGTMEVKGDFVVNSETYGFTPELNHKLVLCGGESQKVSFTENTVYKSYVQNLEFANTSTEGVTLENCLVKGSVTDNGCAKKNALLVQGTDVVSSYLGDICFIGNNTITTAAEVHGNVENRGTLQVKSAFEIVGDYRAVLAGKLNIYKSQVTIQGDALIDGTALYGFYLADSQAAVAVAGDFVYEPLQKSSIQYGTITVGGDISTNKNFRCSSNSQFVLNGAQMQTLDMETGAGFAALRVENTSDEGVCAERVFGYQTLTDAENKLFYKENPGVDGFTLEEDTILSGDLLLTGGTLDLNGYTLTIEGNLIQMVGVIDLNGGSLIVNGDFRQQMAENLSETPAYEIGYGSFIMEEDTDYFCVNGDFYADSVNSMNLKAGVVELKGNLMVTSSDAAGIGASGESTIIFSGSEEQIYDSPKDYSYSVFRNVIFNNSSDEGICLKCRMLVTNSVSDISKNVEGGIYPTKDTVFEGQYFSGDIYWLLSGTVIDGMTIGGDLYANLSGGKITGNVIVQGNLYVGVTAVYIQGQTVVEGDIISYGYLYVVNGADCVVNGDYTGIKTDILYIYAQGTMEVKGDFRNGYYTQNISGELYVRGNLYCNMSNGFGSGTIYADGNIEGIMNNVIPVSRLVLSGSAGQAVDLDISSVPRVGILELQNTSEEGVVFQRAFSTREVITNGGTVAYGTETGTIGYTLEEDTVVEGDFVLTDGVLDLNGHTMTVQGNFTQNSGVVQFNGGALIIGGDYRKQTKTRNENDEEEYGTSFGALYMTSETDYLYVEGDYVTQSDVLYPYYMDQLKVGTIEVKGDITCNGGLGLLTSGMTVKLSGEECQVLTNNGSNWGMGEVVCTNPSEIRLSENLGVETLDCIAQTLSGDGYFVVSSLENVVNCKGTVIVGKSTLTKDVEGEYSIITNSAIDLQGHKLSIGNLTVQGNGSMVLNKGQLECTGDMLVEANAVITMQYPEDAIHVWGDFTITSAKSQILTDGLLEIRGDFLQDGAENFNASGNHTVKLARKRTEGISLYVQNVKFAYDTENTKFANLILTRDEDGYVFENELEAIADNVTYDYTDDLAPLAVTNLTAKETEAYHITIVYDKALDESEIAEYQIYRDGVYLASTAATEYQDGAVMPVTTYSYEVFAVDESGNVCDTSPVLEVKSGKESIAPTTPQGFGADCITGKSVTLSWGASQDDVKVAGYILYRNGEAVNSMETLITDTCYRDTGLETGTGYEYQVCAVDTSENLSELSECLKVTPKAPVITSIAPSDYTVLGGGCITLTCCYQDYETEPEDRLVVEYRTADGTWTAIDNITTQELNWNVVQAVCQWTPACEGMCDYDVRYTVTDEDGCAVSRIVTYTVDCEAPELPTDVNVTVENGTAVLTWTPSVSADCRKYTIYRQQDGETAMLIAEIDGRYQGACTDTSGEVNQSYQYYITAVDKFGNETEMVSFGYVTITVDEEAPTVKSLTPEKERIGNVVELKASASDNRKVAQILFMYREAESTQWEELARIDADGDSAVYQWNTAGLNGEYQIGVWAVDEAGNISENEYIRKYAVDNAGPAAPVWKEIVPQTITAILSWEENTEEDLAYYQIEKMVDDGWVAAGTTSANKYQITGLDAEHAYSFRVVGYDNLGNRGAASEEITVETLSDTQGPSINRISPVASAYRSSLSLEMWASDNCGVASMEFAYSTDGVTFTEIGTYVCDGKKEESKKVDFDISTLPEGKLYVRFRATDTAGNRSLLLSDGGEVIVEYLVDRTAPEKPDIPTAFTGNGYVLLSWEVGDEEDISCYRIYRADSENGEYQLLKENCSARSYYDTSALSGKGYYYKIVAVDVAGNESISSDSAYGVAAEDKEAPVLVFGSSVQGAKVGKDAVLRVGAYDNVNLQGMCIQCRQKDAEELWQEVYQGVLSGYADVENVTWSNAELVDGIYEFRAWAWDAAGNTGETVYLEVELDLTAPYISWISAEGGHWQNEITFSDCMQEDLAYYEVWRRVYGNTGNFEKLTQTQENQYTDAAAEPGVLYEYQVRTYDTAGNYSVSEIVTAVCDDVDMEAPEAVIAAADTAVCGMELYLDGTASKDNVRVTEFVWDMGNGDILTGATNTYTYSETGTYVVTLTVSDEAGYTAQTTKMITVLENNGAGTLEIKVTDELGKVIPYAYVYIESDSVNGTTLTADGSGYVYFAGEAGSWTLAAYKNGYLPADTEVSVVAYQKTEVTLVLKEGNLVQGDLTVRKLDLAELIEAGVDFSDPDNYNVFAYSVTLQFEKAPIPVEYVYIPIEGESKEIISVSDNKNNDEDENKNSQITCIVKPLKIEEEEEGTVPVLTYLAFGQTISWLKDMYSVDLGILNAAESGYNIEDSWAELELPEGLSLAALQTEQSTVADMGTIEGQSRKSASWIIRGDKSGTYQLSAEFYGTLMPFEKPVSAKFETEADIKVESGKGIVVYVYPEKAAYIDEMYYIEFSIKNESDRTFYNLFLGRLDNEEGTEYIVPDSEKTNGGLVVGSNDSISIGELAPGESIDGVQKISFLAEGDPEKEYYKLTKYVLSITDGADTGVNVKVIPVSSHINKTRTVYEFLPNYFADPIDFSTGAFTENIPVMTVYGATELSLEVSYNSMEGEHAGEMGYGWSHGYEAYLEESGGNIKVYPYQGSAVETFVYEGAFEETEETQKIISQEEYPVGIYRCTTSGMTGSILERREDGTSLVTNVQGDTLEFDEDGRLTAMTMATGTRIEVTHTEQETVLEDVVSGRYLSLHYNGEHLLTRVTDNSGREAVFSYENNRLAAYTDVCGYTTVFTYDEAGNLLTAINAAGAVYVTNTYDENHRVLAQTDALGNTINIAYEQISETEVCASITTPDSAVRTVNTVMGRITQITDADGGITKYGYDYYGNVTMEIDACGGILRRTYDSNGNITRVTDTCGNTETYTYDEKGNLILYIDEAGNITTNIYDEHNRAVKTTDAAGMVTNTTYDENGLPVTVTAGSENVEFSYEQGRITVIKDGLGNETTYTYTSQGFVESMTDALGNVTSYTYDNAGRLLTETDGAGTITYTYDCNGDILSVTDREGNTTYYEYNLLGVMTAAVSPDGTRESYEYDVEGNLTGITYPDGTECQYEYDVAGNLIQETAPDGSQVSYEYDALGRIIRVTDAEGGTTGIAYRADGKMTSVTDSLGNVTGYAYNSLGNVTSVTNGEGETTTYTYDSIGNLTGVTNGEGETTSYTYDQWGRVTSETDALGNTTSYTYDVLGNRIKTTDAMGTEYIYSYDALGRLIRSQVEVGGELQETTVEYDALGNITAVVDEEGNRKYNAGYFKTSGIG